MGVEFARWLPLIRLCIVVEGKTEIEFVKSLLANHLGHRQVVTSAVSMDGNISVQRLGRRMADMYRLFDGVTSLVDFYGFRNKRDVAVAGLEEGVKQVVRSHVRHAWDERKVIPYVQMHEFEALLFADVQAFSAIEMPAQGIGQLAEIVSRIAPEDIDDDPISAPSKRIAAVMPRGKYDKIAGANIVASEVGLPAMRAACPRFDAWITRLEALG